MTRSSPTWRRPTERNKLYAAGARAYERHAETSIYNARYERPAMLRSIGDVAGLRILDAGCGPGYYCAALGSKAASILALDASEDMIALVEAKALANVDARVHDLSEPLVGIESESIDLVLSSLMMHYLASWDVALAEFNRVLAPGGRAIVSTHHPAMTAPHVEDYFTTQGLTDTWEIGGVDNDVSYYHRSMESIVDAFVDAGFRLERLREPRLNHRRDASEAERRLALKPWFLIIEVRRA